MTKTSAVKVEHIDEKQKVADNPYRVVNLGAHEEAANQAIQDALNDGYTTLKTVYTVITPASSSVAFAVMEK